MFGRFAQVSLYSKHLFTFQRQYQKILAPSLRLVSTNTKKLIKTLQKEYKHEVQNYAVEESIQNYVKDQNFKIIENANDAQIKVQKQITKNKIMEIIFIAKSPPVLDQQQSQQQSQEQSQEQSQQNNQNEKPEEEQKLFDFQINIIKQQSNEGITLLATAIKNQIHIRQIRHLTELTTEKLLDEEEYRGPEFFTLDQDLQESFIEFLKSCGVDEKLFDFIEKYSQDREQRLYMQWLNDVEKFVSK